MISSLHSNTFCRKFSQMKRWKLPLASSCHSGLETWKNIKRLIKDQLENISHSQIYLDHTDIGMTKDQYLRMVEQTGEEIDWERCPPEMEDFPSIVIDAMKLNAIHTSAQDIHHKSQYFDFV